MNEGWISIEDRVPDTLGCPYLVTAVNRYGQREHFIAYRSIHTENGWEYDSHDRKPEQWTITHWRKIDFYQTTRLQQESRREKSERYECTSCGGICYFPHGKHRKIWYKFCPNCGREVNKDA